MLRTTLGLLLTPALLAQVAPGDIALTGFSTTAFGLALGGTTIQACTTPGFQGTSPGTSQAILWDELAPTSFVLGGFGFLGRATIAGPGSVSYTLLSNNVGIVSGLSWDASRDLLFADSGTAQLRRYSFATNAVTDVTTGPQPWGQDLNAGALDALTGDWYGGGNGAIWRVPAGASTALPTPVASGLGGYVTGIAFDPVTGELLATVLTVNRVVRVAANGTVSDVCPPGSVPGPNALDVDHDGDLVTGGGTGQVHRIPRAGGAPVFLVNNTSPFGNVNGVAVAFGGGYGRPFGTGCAAATGPATLRAAGPFRTGGTLTTTSQNHAANTLGVLVLGLSNTSWLGTPLPLPLDPLLGTLNCALLASGDVTLAGVAGPTAPADLVFPLALPPAFQGARFFAQHVGLEPVPGGLSWSNGLAFAIR